ncbi:hypothetical protein [Catenulispora rubra]|uniref:hypothetical protein n=1 Tax=Catenulispora rubra TaxID=280293 RepID=UPI0018924C7F|nr:hypothetical protein [Catenulispora rubra]
MPAPLLLTFAELEFLLASCPRPTEPIRERLRLTPNGPGKGVMAAGLASLVIRGLCVADPADPENPDGVTLQPELLAVTATLASSHTQTSAGGWYGEQAATTHFFDTPRLRIAFRPGTFGHFAVDLGDGAEPLSKAVNAFVDWCARDGGPAATVVQSTAGGDVVSLAVALKPDGTWYLSDDADSPDHGTPTSRAVIRRQLADLLDRAPDLQSAAAGPVPAARPHAGA